MVKVVVSFLYGLIMMVIWIISAWEGCSRISISLSSFKNLKRLESENYFKSPRLAPKDSYDNESYKVRNGQVGGYREYLSAEDIQYIDKLVGELGCEFTSSQRLD